ncbi:MAG TPA: hypothetical protein VF027_10315 [Sphingomicrobium sp.]
MKFAGTIAQNLTAAVRSARRLKGQPIHVDTLGHWRALLEHARCELAKGSGEGLQVHIRELENALDGRVP